jgi:hypothetical protein
VPPAFDPAAMDLQLPAGPSAATAHPPAAPEPDRDDHPSLAKLTSITDAPGRRRSRLNAVQTRTSPSFAGRLTLTASSLPPRAAPRRRALRNLQRILQLRKPCSTSQQGFGRSPTTDRRPTLSTSGVRCTSPRSAVAMGPLRSPVRSITLPEVNHAAGRPAALGRDEEAVPTKAGVERSHTRATSAMKARSRTLTIGVTPCVSAVASVIPSCSSS